MPLKLSSPITELPRVGPVKAKFLAKIGINYVRDLLYQFPRRYDDFSQVTNIKELKVGERQAVQGKVVSVKDQWGFRGRQRLLRTFATIADETGTLAVTWYNLRFLSKQLWGGRSIRLAGIVEAPPKNISVNFSLRSPVVEFVDAEQEGTHTAAITPVYSETFGVTSRWLRYQVKNLMPLINTVPEYLPEDIRRRQNLIGIHEAIRIVHFPDSPDTLAAAQKRLRFDELFFLQLAALVRRQQRQKHRTVPLIISDKKLQQLQNELPFTLTKAQERAVQEIRHDIRQATPMNRLLQGDVGSGKSAVALLATQSALQAHRQVLYLAPTEILARQQAERFRETIGKENVALLIGALKEREKKAIKERLQASEPLCVVGTHALLQEDVATTHVGLVIIDEQHRFGVAQRAQLAASHPHLLSMTATPIPRTLNLTVYGDLDVSILDELPPGRTPIKTKVVSPTHRDEAILHILEELHRGRQAYVIAPLVAPSPRLEAKSATETVREMQQFFPGIAIGLLHGQLSSAEKEAAMRLFASGAMQLLVSTVVVEVGVDVPNATVMVIEGAERFGLSQLHQLRGRIGRGQHQSYCYLFPTSVETADTERLNVIARTTDGFVIAEEDLRLRGPGEVYGLSQSGFGDLQVASLLDYSTIKAARVEAEALLRTDPRLTQYPILSKKVAQKNLITHFE